LKKQIKEKLKSSCEESNRRARVEKIAKILEAVKYKTETDRLQAVLSFSRSKLTEGEIEDIMSPGKPDYLAGQEYRKGVY
jgi:hypothetical protein